MREGARNLNVKKVVDNNLLQMIDYSGADAYATGGLVLKVDTAAQIRRKNSEREKTARHRKQHHVDAIKSNFNELRQEIEYLTAVIMNCTLLDKFRLPSDVTSAPKSEVNELSNENNVAEGTEPLADSENAQRYAQRYALPFLSDLANFGGTSASTVPDNQNLVKDALATLGMLSKTTDGSSSSNSTSVHLRDAIASILSLSISTELKEIAKCMSTRRFAMPKIVKSLGNEQDEDPAETLAFRKERSRLHAKLTRTRKKLLSDKITASNEEMDSVIKSFYKFLNEAGISLPTIDFSQAVAGELEAEMTALCSEDVQGFAFNDKQNGEYGPRRGDTGKHDESDAEENSDFKRQKI